MLRTYRARIVFYNAVMMAFLIAILSYTYLYSRDLILQEAELNSLNFSNLLRSNIELEEEELLRYTEVVRDDANIQEYLFIANALGGGKEALWSIFRRNFAWLPARHSLFLDNRGNLLAGDPLPGLAQAVLDHVGDAAEGLFYFQTPQVLTLVTWARIDFEGKPQGLVVLTHPIDHEWLRRHHFFGGHYLLTDPRGETIVLSDLAAAEGQRFAPRDGLLHLAGQAYRVRPIPLSGEGRTGGYRLWLAISEQALLDKLAAHTRLILILLLLGGAVVLITGLLIVRQFSRPMDQLMAITRAVTEGELPKLDKASENNELGMLTNRFAEMLSALREKQAEIERVQRELERNAITDSLTGLYNRRHLADLFPKLLAQARREKTFLCALLLDLDHFKRINDEYGHLTGDACLRHASQLLRASLRASDFVFRIGGEEFLVLSLNETFSGGQVLAEKIRDAFARQPCRVDGRPISMTVSIGVCCADDGRPPQDALSHLLSQADQALYRAKAGGRNQVQSYNAEAPGAETGQGGDGQGNDGPSA